jgi:hypothetical protein
MTQTLEHSIEPAIPDKTHHRKDKGFHMKRANGNNPRATPQRMLRAKVKAPSFWTLDLI